MSKAGPDIGQAKLFDVEQTHLTLADRFLIPPFSILDARGGYWQQRKRAWLDIGITSELGRDEKLLGFESIVDTDAPCPKCDGRGERGDPPKRCRECKGTGKKYGGYGKLGTTSVFDPVLCELVYRWFCPVGGLVLDPFAGGSVRGIVAGMMERRYIGIDLRAEQVEANEAQAAAIEPIVGPVWKTGDARDVVAHLADLEGQPDLVFTCPPYYDLEVYSDSPQDLSNAAAYSEFLDAYRQIVDDCVRLLAPNSFAAIVVGEVRDKMGNYVGLVPDTVRAFEVAGARFYNEAILVTPLGSTPVRTSSQFGGGRKLGKTHQQLLVFVKGDARKAAARNPVEEVAVEQGGATFKADATVELPATGEFIDPADPHGDGIPF
jgi:hypothetical protein